MFNIPIHDSPRPLKHHRLMNRSAQDWRHIYLIMSGVAGSLDQYVFTKNNNNDDNNNKHNNNDNNEKTTINRLRPFIMQIFNSKTILLNQKYMIITERKESFLQTLLRKKLSLKFFIQKKSTRFKIINNNNNNNNNCF